MKRVALPLTVIFLSLFTLAGGRPETRHFPIGVWLQDPLRERNGAINAINYKGIGINSFIGLWRWPSEVDKYPGYNPPAARALRDAGMKVYAGSNQAAVDWNLAHPEFASTFVGYLMGQDPANSSAALNVIYNLADVLNKIAFGVIIWTVATSETDRVSAK